jgi:hypothetical protein
MTFGAGVLRTMVVLSVVVAVLVAGVTAHAGDNNGAANQPLGEAIGVCVCGAYLTDIDDEYGADDNSMYNIGVALWLLPEGRVPWQILYTTGRERFADLVDMRVHRIFLSRLFLGASEQFRTNPHAFGYAELGIGAVVTSFSSEYVDDIAGKVYPTVSAGGGLVVPVVSSVGLRIGAGMDVVATGLHDIDPPIDFLFNLHAGLMLLL